MRRTSGLGVALAFALVLAGCAQKTEQASQTASDSLLAANPTEPPQTGITPQTEYQPESPKQETPPPPKPAASKPKPKPAPPAEEAPKSQPVPRGVTLPAGTAVKINVAAQITSETAQAGDTWTGVVSEPVIIGTSAPIPAGSKVTGVVSAVKPAEKGSRAFLVLGVRTIEVGGRTHHVHATADSIIAGSTRARNVGAVAGSAAAGALIGKAIGGSNKGALVGGLIGGALGTGAVAGSKGYQATIKEGAELTFTTDDVVVMKE
ncbi:MAG TPA: hypothetical protein VGK89_01355 [Candidatus Eisenbacteria bacterium]